MTEAFQRSAYVQAVLAAYLDLPETPFRSRPPDRVFAARLHERRVPLETVKHAMLLAAARRLLCPPDAPRLSPIRSLYYFSPVIEELIEKPLPDGYVDYLKRKLSPFPKGSTEPGARSKNFTF